MKTILGAKIQRVQFYKNSFDKDSISGSIWTDGKFSIIIRRGKFFLQDKDAKSHGLILKGTTAYRKIKRAIAIWFKDYRKKSLMMESASYLRSRCIDGIHNLEIQRIRNRKVNMFQVLGDVLGPVYSQKQFS